jgi:hypothetical protein
VHLRQETARRDANDEWRPRSAPKSPPTTLAINLLERVFHSSGAFFPDMRHFATSDFIYSAIYPIYQRVFLERAICTCAIIFSSGAAQKKMLFTLLVVYIDLKTLFVPDRINLFGPSM